VLVLAHARKGRRRTRCGHCDGIIHAVADDGGVADADVARLV
jgi:hypothetical protein